MLTFLINTIAQVYILILFLYVVLGYTAIKDSPIYNLAGQLVEPVLAPIRKLMPDMGPFDFSPLVLLALIVGVKTLLLTVLSVIF